MNQKCLFWLCWLLFCTILVKMSTADVYSVPGGGEAKEKLQEEYNVSWCITHAVSRVTVYHCCSLNTPTLNKCTKYYCAKGGCNGGNIHNFVQNMGVHVIMVTTEVLLDRVIFLYKTVGGIKGGKVNMHATYIVTGNIIFLVALFCTCTMGCITSSCHLWQLVWCAHVISSAVNCHCTVVLCVSNLLLYWWR